VVTAPQGKVISGNPKDYLAPLAYEKK